MSYKNPNILPRALSYEEKENRKKGIYDSFANYLVYCQKCKHVAKSNMYIPVSYTHLTLPTIA